MEYDGVRMSEECTHYFNNFERYKVCYLCNTRILNEDFGKYEYKSSIFHIPRHFFHKLCSLFSVFYTCLCGVIFFIDYRNKISNVSETIEVVSLADSV